MARTAPLFGPRVFEIGLVDLNMDIIVYICFLVSSADVDTDGNTLTMPEIARS